MDCLNSMKGQIHKGGDGSEWTIQHVYEFSSTNSSNLHGALVLRNTKTQEEQKLDFLMPITTSEERYSSIPGLIASRFPEMLLAKGRPIHVDVNELGGGGFTIDPRLLSISQTV